MKRLINYRNQYQVSSAGIATIEFLSSKAFIWGAFIYVLLKFRHWPIKLINQGDPGTGKFGTLRILNLYPQMKSFLQKNQFQHELPTGLQVRLYYWWKHRITRRAAGASGTWRPTPQEDKTKQRG